MPPESSPQLAPNPAPLRCKVAPITDRLKFLHLAPARKRGKHMRYLCSTQSFCFACAQCLCGAVTSA